MRAFVVLIFALLTACTDAAYVAGDSSEAISKSLRQSGHRAIDFARFAGPDWSRVCFFGPYNERSSDVLGFEWHVGEHTRVLRSDGHNVIVFATAHEVIEYVIHSRGQGDFSSLSGECFARRDARFVKEPEDGQWRTAGASDA